jgi:hypothetical protein
MAFNDSANVVLHTTHFFNGNSGVGKKALRLAGLQILPALHFFGGCRCQNNWFQ